jgi:hypothetical protein
MPVLSWDVELHELAVDEISGAPTRILQAMAIREDIKYNSNNTKQR